MINSNTIEKIIEIQLFHVTRILNFLQYDKWRLK